MALLGSVVSYPRFPDDILPLPAGTRVTLAGFGAEHDQDARNWVGVLTGGFEPATDDTPAKFQVYWERRRENVSHRYPMSWERAENLRLVIPAIGAGKGRKLVVK